MTANYFRALASRCRTDARNCFDLYAKEEFRRLASEFDTKADELELSSRRDTLGGVWHRPEPQPVAGRDR